MEVVQVAPRRSAVLDTVSELQRFIGECLETHPHQQIALLPAFLGRLPCSSESQHEHVLRGLLMDFSVEWGERVHKQLHETLQSGSVSSCPLKTAELAMSIWRGSTRRFPFAAMREWGSQLADEIERQHPEVTALRLRELIDVNYSWPLASIVRAAVADGASAARVRMNFQRIEGCSAHVYLTRRRVTVARELLIRTTEKIETIAHEVGWRSPKDFYRAVSRTTGQTPAEIREAAQKDLAGVLAVAQGSETMLVALAAASVLLNMA